MTEKLWIEQWKSFAPNFKSGKAYIHLQDYGGPNKKFPLLPGPGFGESYHPTTKLCLKAMMDKVKGKTVYDIGSGSGILSVAAYYLDAKQLYSFEIDPNALEHTRENLLLNNFSAKDTYKKLSLLSPPDVIIMNMTFFDQIKALNSCPEIANQTCIWILSGYLQEQLEEVNTKIFQNRLQDLSHTTLEGWVSIVAASH